jgi:hypothetical protein
VGVSRADWSSRIPFGYAQGRLRQAQGGAQDARVVCSLPRHSMLSRAKPLSKHAVGGNHR